MSEPREETGLLGEERREQAPAPTSRTSRVAVVGVAALLGLAVFAFYGNTEMKTAEPVIKTTPKMIEHAKTLSVEKVRYGDMSDDELEQAFKEFVQTHKRLYTDETEEARRFGIFKDNLEFIDELNDQNPFAVFGITERADWTTDERAITRGLGPNKQMSTINGMNRYEYVKSMYPDQDAIEYGAKGPEVIYSDKSSIVDDEMEKSMFGWLDVDNCAACNLFPEFSKYNMKKLPEEFDWRALGAVSSVKNQKYCGSCWSFSTAGDIEGVHYLKTGELISLAEQQLVACDTDNDGCDGGFPFIAMQYLTNIGGMLHEEQYKYKGICAWGACGGSVAGTPHCDKSLLNEEIKLKNVSAITGYQLVSLGSVFEKYMRIGMVKNGPLSIAFNADAMDYYVHGVVGCPDDGYCEAGDISHPATCDPTDIDHAVLLVGYGTENDVPYWVIKNSWSSEWGEDGYYRLIRGINKCGVANFAVHSVAKAMD